MRAKFLNLKKVDYLKDFVIPFSGLKEEIHHFEFTLGKKFFEAMESDEIRDGNIQIALSLDKQARMMIFNFQINGWVNLQCDRCLDYYNHHLQGEERLIIKYGETQYEETEEILIIPHSLHEINISQYLYEFVSLMLPMRKVHPDDEQGNSLCDPEVISKLKDVSVTPSDPRWDELKKLL